MLRVNFLWVGGALWHYRSCLSLFLAVACYLSNNKPLPALVLTYHHWDSKVYVWIEFQKKRHLTLCTKNDVKWCSSLTEKRYLQNGHIPCYFDALTLKQKGNFFQNVFFFLMLFTRHVIFRDETGPMQWKFHQHGGYWWSGALGPGHH